LPANILVLHDVDANGPGLGQHAADVTGHALAVGHAKDQDPLAGQLQEVHCPSLSFFPFSRSFPSLHLRVSVVPPFRSFASFLLGAFA
jgi:hypothetical protein